MEKTIIEQFNERMLDLYAERDFYSRGGIIDKAKEALADIIENNDSLHSVNNCAVCGSDDLFKIKLEHIKCRRCNSKFEHGC
jgi:hypothetical protein